jgi:hypothetical protein
MNKNLNFSEEQIKKINKRALADKYECTPQYIGQVLRGEKGKRKKGQNIRTDAHKLLKILGDPILNIEVNDPEILSA